MPSYEHEWRAAFNKQPRGGINYLSLQVDVENGSIYLKTLIARNFQGSFNV